VTAPDIVEFCPWLRDFVGEMYDLAPDDRLRVAISPARWRDLRAYGAAERAHREELRAARLEFSAWLREQAGVDTTSIDRDLAIEVVVPDPPLPPETPELGAFLGILLGHELYFEALP
jgi:hypothetical protein